MSGATYYRLGAMALLFAMGCAGGVANIIKRGDNHFRSERYAQAIQTYEEALAIEPNDPKAIMRIRKAKRAAVKRELKQAEAAMGEQDYPLALKHASRARRMPLDLQDVELAQWIDATIDKAARYAEDRVRQLVERGHFVAALELADKIVAASPSNRTRREWADTVRETARAHYMDLASKLAKRGLPGSAAIQLALAQEVGAKVEADRVEELWNQFAEPTCFAEPKINVYDRSRKKSKELVDNIEKTARQELEALRSECGKGSRPLGVKITLSNVDVVDKNQTQRHAEALPGFKVKTEEVYYEEVPYTEIEEYTETIRRKEKVEKRDCAPRPGKPRGCRTWFEEVEVEVPITKKREVKKVRRIEKRRPVKGPLPKDKVVTYDVQKVTRLVEYEGTITVTGESDYERKFKVRRESSDEAHDAAQGPGLKIPADPLEVKSMDEVFAEASAALGETVRRAVRQAVDVWSERFAERARKQRVKGELPAAEEAYLKILALGADASEELGRFFSDRYGQSVGEILTHLTVAMGRKASKKGQATAGLFPTRDGSKPKGFVPLAENVDTSSSFVSKAPEKSAKSLSESGVRSAVEGFTDDELQALEDSSLGDKEKKAAAEASEDDSKKTDEKESPEKNKRGKKKRRGPVGRRPIAPK